MHSITMMRFKRLGTQWARRRKMNWYYYGINQGKASVDAAKKNGEERLQKHTRTFSEKRDK